MTAPAFTTQGHEAFPELGPPRHHSVTKDEHLVVPEMAGVLRCSKRTVEELVRLHRIPHVVAPYTRRVLFPPGWVALWLSGAWELQTEYTVGGGRIVRPIPAEGDGDGRGA